MRVRVDGADVLARRAAGDRPPPQARRRGGGRPRRSIRPDARSRIAGSVENALALGRGVLHVAYPRDDVPEPQWPVEIAQPALRLRPLRAELRAAHAAQLLVQQPAGLVPGVRRAGHADRARIPAALLRDPKLTLAEGAVALWPDAGQPRLRADARRALAAAPACPLDVPFERARRPRTAG